MHINHSACMDFKSSNVSPAIVWCVYPKRHYTWLDLSADLFFISRRRVRICNIWCKLPQHLIKGCLYACSNRSYAYALKEFVRCTMIMFEPAVCLCITSSRCHPSAPPHPAGRGTARGIGGVRRSGRKSRSSSYRWTLSSQQKNQHDTLLVSLYVKSGCLFFF